MDKCQGSKREIVNIRPQDNIFTIFLCYFLVQAFIQTFAIEEL